MGFQIAYAIQFIDKFSKVADDLLKKTKMIDKKILGASKNFAKFEKAGVGGLDKVAKATRAADRRMETFTRQTKKQTRASRALGAVLGNLKFRMASLMITGAIGGFGMSALIKKAKPMENAWAKLAALTGITGKDFEFLEKRAFRLARALGVTQQEIATGFLRVAGLKPELIKDVKALAELTKWTLILDAPMGQIEKVSRALTVALNVYGKTADSAARFTNILAAAQRKGSAEVIDMAVSFLKAGPVAETARIPFERLMSVIQGLARAGILKQMAGTSFRTIMIRVAKQSKQQGDTFMGVLRSLSKELVTTEGGLADIAKAAKVFGVRQAHAAIAIMKALPYIEQFEKDIKGTNIAMETANIILGTYERRVLKIWAIWDRQIKDVFKEAGPDLLRLHKQWVMFITQLSMAPPGGLGKLIGLFANLLSDILEIGNALLFVWNIISSPFELAKGWDAFTTRWEKIGNMWNTMHEGTPFAFAPPPTLESLAKPGDSVGRNSAAANGRVQVDVNLKGNTDSVESATATSEGDVDFNMGLNFAY